MTSISHVHELMTNMMKHMMENDQSMQMLMDILVIMGKMMQRENAMGMMGNMMQNMMKIIQKDTSMSRMMGEMMMKDDHAKGMMIDLMKKSGMDDKSMRQRE